MESIETMSQKFLITMRQALDGGKAAQRIKRAQRIAQAERLGAQVVELSDEDMFAASGL